MKALGLRPYLSNVGDVRGQRDQDQGGTSWGVAPNTLLLKRTSFVVRSKTSSQSCRLANRAPHTFLSHTEDGHS